MSRIHFGDIKGQICRGLAMAAFASALAAPTAAQPATPAAGAEIAPPAVAAPAVAPSAIAPAAVEASPAAKPVAPKPRECTRLPLSDIQAGKDKTIEVARLRLGEYAEKIAKQKGWKAWDKSLETVSCEEYLWVPIIGQEYKCLIAATFCKKS